MTKSITDSALSLTALTSVLALLQGTPAEALNNQSYVSGTGSDANNCSTIPLACATFDHALRQTSAGGEITVVDTGNYGAGATITKSVNITNDGAGEAIILVPPGLHGLGVAAGAGDVVSLRGLVIDGQIVGTFGIRAEGAFGGFSALHIQNCVIRNVETTIAGAGAFGIVFAPSGRSQLFVSDSIIFNNGGPALTGGILIEPENAGSSANVVLDRVHLENNVDGLLIDGAATSGPGSHVVVRDSVFSGNAANGIHALTITGFSPAFAFVEHSSMVNNGQSGIRADGPGATVLLNDNTITRNGTGISAINSGQLYSYGNNKNNNNIGPEGAPTGFFSQM